MPKHGSKQSCIKSFLKKISPVKKKPRLSKETEDTEENYETTEKENPDENTDLEPSFQEKTNTDNESSENDSDVTCDSSNFEYEELETDSEDDMERDGDGDVVIGRAGAEVQCVQIFLTD